MTLDDFVHAYDFMFGYTFFLVMNYVSRVLHDLFIINDVYTTAMYS